MSVLGKKAAEPQNNGCEAHHTVRNPKWELTYPSAQEMVFGVAKRPVTCGYGIVLGAGRVVPEVNFTLPPMPLQESTLPEVRTRFRDMVRRVLQRALQLEQPSLVLEFEHLYEMTRNPEWGALITVDIKKVMEEFHQRYELQTALRVTVADIRDQERPPRMRTGKPLEIMMKAFELCADAGADILSIESTGGKEVSDQALMGGDLKGLVFALGVLAPRDMVFLWEKIVEIARRYRILPGGDTACGFANTAMQLAQQGMLPKVLAAMMRLISVPRSLVAIEMGATGPLKDCGYENPVLKAITGVPISMEGKTSACAHSSPLGNIAAAMCDLWSNESVQDVRLLGGFAPEVFTEMLIYDCRLMNAALQSGEASRLRDLLVHSDRSHDPQALMLDPEIVHESAKHVMEAGLDDYTRTVGLARFALAVLLEASYQNQIRLLPPEKHWLALLEETVSTLPATPDQLYLQIEADYSNLFLPTEYGLT